MYDVYRHVDKKELQLTVLQGTDLPKAALVSKWKLFANRKLVPRIISDEVVRIGYCVSRPKTHRSAA